MANCFGFFVHFGAYGVRGFADSLRLMLLYNILRKVISSVNSLDCCSGLVLCFFLFGQDFCYVHDVTTTSNLILVHSFMQLQPTCVRDVLFTLIRASFSFYRVMNFLVTRDLPHSQK